MRFIRLAAALGFLAASVMSHAAPFPSQPIKIVVGFASGSSVDVVTRLIAQKVSMRVGQPVIVENRAGAGGNIAAEYVARATPDGYTLLACNTGYAIAPSLYKPSG